MNYQIREMTPDDGEQVIEIFQEGIEGGNSTFDDSAPTWEGWDEKYFKICRYILEDEKEEVLGWAALQPISNRDCFKGVAEVSIYMKNSSQGKGFGSMLLQKLILGSEEHDFWTLQAGIFPENEASIWVHQKLGFRTVGNREKIGQMKGIWRDIILLERRSKVAGI
ncbi:GNAT family N-acetyltransferase [Chryseobacterium sp. MP_3.2]|uniref:GNAT family N-acetyltransferase n=1 Tax=Chryseobacterium sp. MP_3.2 TaxID=3071712 RepID=UPI002E033784|nr:L-amino acid N-acyltransferase YncA [Chryseobacterium sp. MP_3.2]